MYKVTVDGITIHDSTLGDPAVLVLDGIVKKQANKADSFTFTIYPNNVGHGSIWTLASVIEVYKDDELLFRGRPISSADGWENQRTYTCEGEFAFFNDTILRPYSFTGTVQNYLQTLITQHNNQVAADKQFTLRTVTVTPNDNIVRSNQDHVTTMSEIQEKLLNSLGGYMVVEFRNNTLYLDYLEDGVSSSSQKITIAKNLIDFAREQTGENIATVLVPLGARDESTGERLTIKSVNNGLDYIEDAAAVAQYGRVVTTQIWDDVTVPANLLAKARARMSDYTAIIPKLTLTTVDLSLTDQSIDPIRILEYVTVEDDQHAASGRYLVSEREYHLSAPEQDQVTFGGTQRSISNASAAVKQAIEVVEGQVLSASERVRAILEAATGGNIYFVYDTDGVLSEILIMDTDDPSTAQKIWRWNINGWGYSGDGGQTYTVAATMDGAILATLISTGILQSRESTSNPKFYLDLDTGVLRGNFTELSISGQSVSQIASSAGSSAASTEIANLTQQEIFNILTNNGQTQGIYLQNGRLYINADYMGSGTIVGRRINNGSGTFVVDENGNVTANSLTSSNARITGGTINIQTAAETENLITLAGPQSYTHHGSNGFWVFNRSNASDPNVKSTLQGAGLFIFNTATDPDLIIIRIGALSNGDGSVTVRKNDSSHPTYTELLHWGVRARDDSDNLAVFEAPRITFYDSNGDIRSSLHANPEENIVQLGHTTSGSYGQWTVTNIAQYKGFILNACRGAAADGTGVMASTYIPLSQARLCTSSANESWTNSAQNGVYYAKCYFDIANNRVYLASSGNADCMAKVYGVR